MSNIAIKENNYNRQTKEYHTELFICLFDHTWQFAKVYARSINLGVRAESLPRHTRKRTLQCDKQNLWNKQKTYRNFQ